MKLSIAKQFQVLLGVALLCLSELAMAQAATIFEMTGTAQAVPGAGTPRALRKGDTVNQGDTIVTSAGTTAIVRFDDGQIVALTGSSRFTISTYQYNRAEPAKSNVLFSLLEGGMRAVTGLIGKARPQQVAYRASNATIGI